MFGLGMSELLIVAFFLLFDTVIVGAVIFFVMAKKNKANNAGSSVGHLNAHSSESPFHSSTHSSNAAPLNNEEIVNLLRRGQKLEAIKRYREQIPTVGLKEAKDAVEAIERQL